MGCWPSMPTAALPKQVFAAVHRETRQIQASRVVGEAATMDAATLLARMATRSSGLIVTSHLHAGNRHRDPVFAFEQLPWLHAASRADLLSYVGLTQLAKSWLVQRQWI